MDIAVTVVGVVVEDAGEFGQDIDATEAGVVVIMLAQSLNIVLPILLVLEEYVRVALIVVMEVGVVATAAQEVDQNTDVNGEVVVHIMLAPRQVIAALVIIVAEEAVLVAIVQALQQVAPEVAKLRLQRMIVTGVEAVQVLLLIPIVGSWIIVKVAHVCLGSVVGLALVVGAEVVQLQGAPFSNNARR